MSPGHRRLDATGGELLTLSLNKFSVSPVLIKNEYSDIKISTSTCSKPDFKSGHNTSWNTWFLSVSNEE